MNSLNSSEPGHPESAVPEREFSGFAAPVPTYPTGQPVTAPQQLPGRRQASFRVERFLRAPATYVLLAANIAVFLWMVLHGVSAQSPTEYQLIRFGANNAEFVVLGGQWWRILTAMFVHVGMVHLLTNMWCLWNLGLLGEPLLGFFGMISVYLLTGAAGNLLSVATDVWFRNYGIVGAGASGAVFGIAGILIVLLSNRRLAEPRNGRGGVPLAELHALRRSVINFAGINLLIGLGSAFQSFLPIHIDNRAHLGGFICGLLLGVPLLSAMTLGRQRYLERQRLVFGASALILVMIAKFVRGLA
ncbi:rhomboid family intramembrane serine protease [Terriglobus aquaticus]|uniref:Rhomboid family intramembrane serine protease n=1 Tax=Terriglobus aquaticus TaxID=940139 RepID=A0ABW9KGM0_9BACT|nr:rhomboid family intramembrane serine protease [Terriglobus aquaticus]